jgi:hypothetical protein
MMREDDYELDVELSGHVPVFKILSQYLLYRIRRKQRISEHTWSPNKIKTWDLLNTKQEC